MQTKSEKADGKKLSANLSRKKKIVQTESKKKAESKFASANISGKFHC